MHLLQFLLFSAVFSTPLISALDVRGRIEFNEVCPGIKQLGRAKVVLNNGAHTALVRRDGSFVLHDIDPGAYVLNVLSQDYHFEQLRVDVVESIAFPEIRPYIIGTPFDPPALHLLPYPISLSTRQKRVYFAEEQGFNLLGMFKNPMMLMMLFTAAMAFGMPRLMKNMDPDVVKQVQQNQQKFAAMQSSMQSLDFGGLTKIINEGEGGTPTKDAPGTKAKAGKGKRK